MGEDIRFTSSDNPVLSAVIPITKMAGKLENFGSWIEHIDSFPIQVIVVHDVQDKETSPELMKILNGVVTDKIVLLEGNFHSPGLARNQGILKAEGDWITFWDSDDLPSLGEAFRAISESSQDISALVTGFQVISYKTKEVLWRSAIFGAGNNAKAIATFPGVWRMIFRREIIQGTKFREFNMAEDQFFLIENEVLIQNTAFCNGVTYSYFVDFPSQLTSQKKKIADLTKVISALTGLNKSQWSELDLRLSARIILTVLTKGSFHSKMFAAILVPKLFFTLGVKNSFLLLYFQALQVTSEIINLARIGSGKLLHAFKN